MAPSKPPMAADAAPDVAAFLARARAETDAALEAALPDLMADAPAALRDAVSYAVLGPGKRFRPALVLAAYETGGGTDQAVAELAAAVEIVHSYSLVHDDLPCMDNDDLRRGRPTLHRAMGVRTATVAGFAMVPVAAAAVRRGAQRLGLSDATARDLVAVLFRAAGGGGMIGGQVMDLLAGGREVGLAFVEDLERRKTGALIAASVEIGAVAAGVSDAARSGYRAYGQDVGLAFQIADDVLDLTATTSELGKTPGKDAKLGKPTWPVLTGLDAAHAEAERLAGRAVAQLEQAGVSSPLLAALARFVVARRS
jgi:geranylgeranyl pyrophosphate synthase